MFILSNESFCSSILIELLFFFLSVFSCLSVFTESLFVFSPNMFFFEVLDDLFFSISVSIFLCNFPFSGRNFFILFDFIICWLFVFLRTSLELNFSFNFILQSPFFIFLTSLLLLIFFSSLIFSLLSALWQFFLLSLITIFLLI